MPMLSIGALTRAIPTAITVGCLWFLTLATTGSRILLFLTAFALLCCNCRRLFQLSDRILIPAVGDHDH